MWKANKVLDKELAPSMLGHRRPFEYRRVPRLGLSLSRNLKARASKQTWRASTPQMGIQPEIRVKRRHGVKPVLPMIGPPSIVWKGLIYLLILHRDQWIIQNYAASAALTLIKTRLSLCIPNCVHRSQVIYIIFQPEGQLTFYSPFLIRICQAEDLFVLFFPKSGATLRKH